MFDFFYLNARLSPTHFPLGTGKTKDTPHFEVLVRAYTLPNLWAPTNCASILFGAPAVGGIFFFYHDTYNRTKTLMLTYYHKGNVILLSYCWFKSILLNNWVCYQEIKLYFLPCFKLLSKCE